MNDDFIHTISDDDTSIPNLDEEEADAEAKDIQNLKRKRDDNGNVETSAGKKKRRKQKPAGDIETQTAQSSSGDEGVFDPEFYFDLGAASGASQNSGLTELNRNDVVNSLDGASSIDQIIARRRGKGVASKLEVDVSSDEDVEEVDEEGLVEDDEGIEDAAEDEANDEGSQSASEDEGPENGETSKPQSNGDAQIRAAESDEEDEEVAEHVPHPDDDLPMQDEASDVDEEEEDPEVKRRRDAFFEAATTVAGKPISTTSQSFNNMSLSRHVLRGLAASGFSSPTPIQAKAIPVALMGKDIVGGAVTGSGKTAAFLIPIIERLLYRDRKLPTTRVGVLLPTRELAVQCHKVAQKLASSVPGLSIALIVGGLSLREQEQTLKQRPDIVIATPGRFIDHMRNTASFAVENLEILVLDEADRMLEDGFADELNEILTTIPKSRQTMLFSATMTEDVDQLIRVGLTKPVRLMVDAKKQTVSGLVQEFIKLKGGKEDVDEERRLAYLLHLCSNVYTTKTIVFCPRKSLAHRLKVLFALHGIKAAELHGSMSQEQRMNAINQFQSGQCAHLLATDLASRGLDIPRVETVINFTVPTTSTTYLHRVGRTARAGESGVSCTLFSAVKPKKSGKEQGPSTSDRTLLRPILKLARNQKATIRTRTLPPDIMNALTDKIRHEQEEIDAILQEEKEERLLQQTERDATKGENLIKYEDEIKSRPRRTWFQSEKDKLAASKLGKEQRSGLSAPPPPAEKKIRKKLSGKEKKKLANKDERAGATGPGWKKGRDERLGKGVLEREKQKKKQNKVKEKSRESRPSKPSRPQGRGKAR